MTRQELRNYAFRHPFLLKIYRLTLGKVKTGLYFGMQRRALQKNGFGIISRIDKALYNTGAVYFVDCGTLLGLAREGRLIAHDMDLDFGIYLNDEFTAQDLDNAMAGIGLKKHRAFVYRGKVEEVSYSDGIINIDFFVHEEVGDNSYLHVFYKKEGERYKDKNQFSVARQERKHITSIIRTDIGGMELFIPENLEEYLASAYTENWRIPDPAWQYTMEPGFTLLEGEYGCRI